MDGLKEIFAALESRIKSKIVGSVLLAFLATNWKVIFFVLFAKKTVEEKFQYFDGNTSYLTLFLIPIIIGTFLAIFLPWVNACGLKLTALPDRMQRDLQSQSRHQDDIKNLEYATQIQELKARQQQAIVASAKADEEAKSIKDPQARLDVIEKLDSSENIVFKHTDETTSRVTANDSWEGGEEPSIDDLENRVHILRVQKAELEEIEVGLTNTLENLRETDGKNDALYIKTQSENLSKDEALEMKIKRAKEIEKFEEKEIYLVIELQSVQSDLASNAAQSAELVSYLDSKYQL